jgi:hypothetical protein
MLGAVQNTRRESKTHTPGHIEVRINREIECRESFGFPGSNVFVKVRAMSRET